MLKWFHNLTTGETDYFNETSSSDSYVEGFDSNGDYHHINKCGNMGIDSSTGDTFFKTGSFVHGTGSGDTFRSAFDDDDDDPFGF